MLKIIVLIIFLVIIGIIMFKAYKENLEGNDISSYGKILLITLIVGILAVVFVPSKISFGGVSNPLKNAKSIDELDPSKIKPIGVTVADITQDIGGAFAVTEKTTPKGVKRYTGNRDGVILTVDTYKNDDTVIHTNIVWVLGGKPETTTANLQIFSKYAWNVIPDKDFSTWVEKNIAKFAKDKKEIKEGKVFKDTYAEITVKPYEKTTMISLEIYHK